VPNTNPCIDSKTNIEYIKNTSLALPVQILPIGAVTTATHGKTLAEMIEMRDAGAVAFSDGTNPIQQAGLLVKALQYVKAFQGTIMQVPMDISLSINGFVNEGILSTQLGLPGIPAIAEEIMVARDIALCAYANSSLHLTGISTAKSLELIKAAKAKLIRVTCSVTPYHLLLNEEEIQHYNTDAKVNPPLRTKEDMLALQKGLLDGTIDCIASHHFPQELDAKQCEFGFALYGMSTIENCFQAIASIPGITAEKIYFVLSRHCKAIFGLPENGIAVQQPAIASLFQLDTEELISKTSMISKGKNNAFTGKSLQGKIRATLNHQPPYIEK
jgi:dihydroorotase